MPNSIIAYQLIICLYIYISLYEWQLLNLLVSKPNVANQPLSCHAHVNSSIFFSNTYSIFMSPQSTQGFQSSSHTYVHGKPSFRGRGYHNFPPLQKILSSKFIYLYPQTKYRFSCFCFYLLFITLFSQHHNFSK